MALSTSENPLSPSHPGSPRLRRSSQPGGDGGLLGLSAWSVYGLIIVVAVLVGGVSLLAKSTPSYDPWSWLVWGREIIHGSLHTHGGPSWKPLPVIFTTIFALFGHIAPDLWLIVSRAGIVITTLMTGKLALRAVLWLAPAPSDREPTWVERVGRVGPALLAGVIAAVSVALSGHWLSDSALGYSEALAAAFLLIGLERHVDGHPRQAFACGLVAALDRPEIWAFWVPYGLWLAWRDAGARRLVVAIFVLTIILWFAPQQWGGGSPISGLVRATQVRSNSNALKSFPFWAEFQTAWDLMIFRMKVASVAMLAGGLLLLGYDRRTRNRANARLRLSPLQRRGLVLGTVLAMFGYAWWILISLETQAGFSGNDRYLTIGVAALTIAGAMTYGGLAILLAQVPRLWVPEHRERLKLAPRLVLGTAVLGAFFLAFPNWVGSNFISLPTLHKALYYQAGLRRDMVDLIRDHGGVRALEHCGAGEIEVEGFQLPMAAWYFDDRLENIRFQPKHFQRTGPWPNVIMQDADTQGANLLPSPQQITEWTKLGAHYKVIPLSESTLYMDCSAQPHDPPARTSS